MATLSRSCFARADDICMTEAALCDQWINAGVARQTDRSPLLAIPSDDLQNSHCLL